FFFFSSSRRHTRFSRDWSSDVALPILPHAETMGVIGLLALAANISCALMLWRHREGDANRRSVWICSRNDAIGNIAVVAAALGEIGRASCRDRAQRSVVPGPVQAGA